MATQSLTLSQTHHLLLALEFTNGTLKMKGLLKYLLNSRACTD